MDVRKDIEKLCLANGRAFNRDVYEAWENFIKEDIEKYRYEICDVEESLRSLIRETVHIRSYGELYCVFREAAKKRISSENVKCFACRREINIPAIVAIESDLKTGCACGETRQSIMAHYHNNPVIQSLWGGPLNQGNQALSPHDKSETTPPLHTKEVEYYD